MENESFSRELMFTQGKNDECYTPAYGVVPILKYIPENAIVWCPFDTSESEFVKHISKQNEVVYSHLENGQDFYTHEPKSWDVMVSNPPFTNKKKIFERALSFNKPFALIMTNTWLNDSAPKKLFAEKELQLSIFVKEPLKVIHNLSPILRKLIKWVALGAGYGIIDVWRERLSQSRTPKRNPNTHDQ